MKLRFIGDVHGKWNRYKKLIQGQENTLQVGDFGVGFRNLHGENLSNPPFDQMAKGNNLFLRGNHDNPAVCRKQKFWVHDGDLAFDGRVFVVGGAESYDKQWRFEGIDWWADEELTYRELNLILDLYEREKPDIVATHDAAQCVITEAYKRRILHTPGLGCGQRTRQMFDNMLEIHRPKLWVNGHWHTRWDIEIQGTRFLGLEELGVLDVDLP